MDGKNDPETLTEEKRCFMCFDSEDGQCRACATGDDSFRPSLPSEQLDNQLLAKAVAEGIGAVDKDELLRVMLDKLVSVIRVTNTLGELVEKKPSGLILPEHLN